MSTGQKELLKNINHFREKSQEASQISGITKATYYIFNANVGPNRTYMKLFFISHFRSLLISLSILTKDSYSNIRIQDLLRDFELKFGAKLKQVESKKNEYMRTKKRLDAYKDSIVLWNNLRDTIAAHDSFNYEEQWTLDIATISNFIEDVIKLINIVIDITNTPDEWPNCTYSNKIAINLEEDTCQEIKSHLKWISDY
jgi:hypothetical protein